MAEKIGARSVKIRDFMPGDRPFLERGVLAELKDEAPFDPLKLVVPPDEWGRSHSAWLLKQARTRGGCLLVAVVGQKRVGFVAAANVRASPKRRSFEPDKPSAILSLYVLPEFRRRGIGNRLMDVIERRFRAKGRDFVHLIALSGNIRALELYRARGYAQRVLYLGKWLTPRARQLSRAGY